ncbi:MULTISPECIES: HlyD family efflux transporter periplasmic adaptor subunit [unclassified Nostoc]|uniref:HlyD family efflux transporter periplasmic adaptor subunit n=1 Tax=unclassified Nostoc TaxID=2593658 RepID=UPI00262683FA|nr:HlyD family efflux transporter periplasmic adaptor subunit [Nostoc sp. S13]MDF5738398.1 HlyD family efflux transporter periplasmic adaptor subunit [Nostoc sp. S13]
MPNTNRSSPLPKDEPNEHQSYTQQEESLEFNEQTETENDSQDLHYGTEGLLNALPRIWTRGLLYLLIGFAGLILPWATLSRVDETGSARGRIEPKGATQKLDSQTGGSVKAVRVKEGDTVRAGQVLLELNSDLLQTGLQEEQSSYKSLMQAGKLAVMKNQEQLKDLQTQITAAQSEVAQTKSQITSIRVQMQQRVVRSPINGVIFELPTTKPGAVVQAGQRIAQIAPKNADFVLKAQIPNQDSGFLKVGMPVKVKFDAYPFQEYGIVQGKVTWISPDSKVNQIPQGNIETYELEITLEKQYVENGNKRIPFGAGQTANAEVIIRQRRVIDFVLDPFKKLQKGGLEM